MRIAFVTPEFITESNFDGGLANYLFKVTFCLKQYGHQPIVIVATDRNEVIDFMNIPVIRVNTHLKLFDRIAPWAPNLTTVFRWIWQSWKLNQKLKQHNNIRKIDVAQFSSYTATALFRPVNIPSVIRISSLQPMWDPGYGVKHNSRRNLIHYLELRSIKNSDMITAPSRFLSEYLKYYINRNVKVIQTPYLPFENSLKSQLPKQINGKKYLLFFGSIGQLKGAKLIADIIHLFLSNHTDLFFVFAGKDAGYRGRPMMEYIRMQAGVYQDRVIHLGSLRHSRLMPVIENSEAVVLPSLVDNFPNTCIEAMGLGKIVIGSKNSSFEELITDEFNGFLCENNQCESLLHTIEKVLSLTDTQKRQIRERAKNRIEMLKPENIVGEFIKLYEEVAWA